MNKYLHAVGFCVGLVAVILLSVVNGAMMTEGWLTVPTPLNKTAYALLWLAAYVLTAASIGEFTVTKPLRRFLFLPILLLVFTGISFWAFYRLHNFLLNAIALGLAIATEGVVLVLLTKNTRFGFAGATFVLLWYCYLFGVNIVVWVLS